MATAQHEQLVRMPATRRASGVAEGVAGVAGVASGLVTFAEWRQGRWFSTRINRWLSPADWAEVERRAAVAGSERWAAYEAAGWYRPLVG